MAFATTSLVPAGSPVTLVSRGLSFGRTFAAYTVVGSRKPSHLPIQRMAAPSRFAGALLRRRRKRQWEASVERNKGRRARQGRGIVVMGAMVGCVLVMGCQSATRTVLASFDALDEGSIRPGKAGDAALAADQPIVRRATVQEVPPEQGMPRDITLLPPSQRAAAAQARRTVEPLGTVRAVASGPGVVVAEPVARQADGTARFRGRMRALAAIRAERAWRTREDAALV